MSVPYFCLCEGYRNVCTDMTSTCYGKCSKCCGADEQHNEQLKSWAADASFKPIDVIKKIHNTYLKHLREHHGFQGGTQKHIGNGAPKGAFAFTLTKSPNDDLTEEDMIRAVRKVMSQKSCPVKRYAWYLEYGNKELKEHPHIHGMYETESGGVIEKKHWSRAWKIWDPATKLGAGFRGGYHRPVRSEEDYDDYIRKQNGIGEHS